MSSGMVDYPQKNKPKLGGSVHHTYMQLVNTLMPAVQRTNSPTGAHQPAHLHSPSECCSQIAPPIAILVRLVHALAVFLAAANSAADRADDVEHHGDSHHEEEELQEAATTEADNTV